ncbi:LADA_0H17304g1_1 [Lachancea dasiensis]|uniref:LADA_0H17304g1_1 n=1 Tax=Lachancea dasiensis TaxID=1072105 RepID=A0A1G4K5H1_9SACH|nr:LADA_0H17304g1_1 [Lachancea dasiensis]
MLSIESIDHADSVFNSTITVQCLGGCKTTFHLIYLMDNCVAPESLHPQTKQRITDVFNGPLMESRSGFANANKCVQQLFSESQFEIHENELVCRWRAGQASQFSEEWLVSHSYLPKLYSDHHFLPKWSTWDSEKFKHVVNEGPIYNYPQLPAILPDLMKDIYTYGFGFIEKVPATLEATKEVSELISIVRPTHYDLGVWDFTSDLAKNDTAYTTLGIDMHTDGNYWNEPPGLQLFHLLEHSSGSGGETRIVDVAKVVEIISDLSNEDESWKTTLQVLTKQPIAFHQAGEKESCFTQSQFPILTMSRSGQLQQCRWNNSDRSPQFPQPLLFSVGAIYEALFRFNTLINDPTNYVQFQLSPGKILVFDNWRVLHARNSFTGYRRLCGSYLTRDDFLARLRGFTTDREVLLNAL